MELKSEIELELKLFELELELKPPRLFGIGIELKKNGIDPRPGTYSTMT